MNVSLYQAAAAMNAQTRWQEIITENLAAGQVPGSRKEEVSFEDVAAASPVQMSGVTPTSFYLPTVKTSLSFQQGELRPTRNSTDLAIEGSGFFEVQLPSGEKAYTRDGEFQMNAKGQLTTKQGYLVLSDAGPIQFDPNNSLPFTVSSTGQITQGGNAKGQLRIVNFPNVNQLTTTSGGYLIANQPGVMPKPVGAGTTVRQGYLESPNMSPTMEMGSLISAMRTFEANQKVLQSEDDRMGKIISDLSGVS